LTSKQEKIDMEHQSKIKNKEKNATEPDLKDLYDELDFSAEHSDNLPLILKKLNISLAFTSYQAGRLMLVRSDGENIDINFKSFHRPMGLTVTEDSLTLGTFSQIIKFQREDGLLEKIKQPLEKIENDITAPRIKAKDAENIVSTAEEDVEQQAVPESTQELEKDELTAEEKLKREETRKQIKAYQEKQFSPVDERVDSCFITRSAHYSGMINIHDIDWGDEGLWAVNSSFSCLCTVEADSSFVPRWKPHFISDLVPEDRCHLNGMTLKDGKPAYVTTFSQEDKAGNWRSKNGKFDGTLMDVASNKILIDGLAMPHSPRWHNGYVYFCNSGHGLLCRYNPETKVTETIAEVPGFTRGMDFYGSLLFVGLSKIRQGDVTRPAPLGEKYDETFSGIWVFNLDDINDKGYVAEVAHISFTGNVDQIYDIAILPNTHFPELIEPTHPRMRNHFCHPELVPLS